MNDEIVNGASFAPAEPLRIEMLVMMTCYVIPSLSSSEGSSTGRPNRIKDQLEVEVSTANDSARCSIT